MRLLRSLGVTFGVAFTLKFVVLNALADPASGRLGRTLQMLLEGVTLGALTQEVQHRAAGYIAFVTVGMFLLSVWMLPGRMASSDRPYSTGPRDADRRRMSSSSTGLAEQRTGGNPESYDGPA